MADNNCFTFNPLVGFSEGIQLSFEVPRLNNNGTYPPHLRVGGSFLQVDSLKKPIWKGDKLVSASIRRVDTEHSSFDVLSGKTDDAILVLVNLDTPAGMKRKLDPESINAWVSFESNGADIVMSHPRSGRCLAVFSRDDDDMIIFAKDGMVHHLVRRNGSMETIHLPLADMAKERVRLMRAHLDDPEVTQKRRHAVLGNAVRLLEFAHDDDARVVLMDFLCNFAGLNDMPTGMRKHVRFLFQEYGDTRAAMFLPGASFLVDNVVPISKGNKRKIADAKRTERIERDRQLRSKMRDASK